MVTSDNENTVQTSVVSKVEIAESPLKSCTVSLSEVISAGKRLDAQKYDVALRAVKTSILHNKYGFRYILGSQGYCTAYRPGIRKRLYVNPTDEAIAMFTPSQITEVRPKTEKYLSKKFCRKIPDWFVKKGEILLTCSGTIGGLSLTSKTLEGKCVSQNLIRITPKDAADTGYVYAYLKSPVGQLFLTRNNYGAVIQHIDPEHLATVPIPDAPEAIKARIHEMITTSYALRDESNDLIDEATTLLIKELNLPSIHDFDVERFDRLADVNTFSVTVRNLMGRVDASYHVPIVKAIEKHIQHFAAEVTTIGDKRVCKDILLPGRFKRVYVDKGYGVVFFGGRSIGELDPADKRYLSFSQHDARIRNELTIRTNMILVTCSGTIGNVALVPKHWNNWAMTHDIIRLIPNDDMIGYLYVWLQSEYANALIKSYAYGSVVQHVEKEHIQMMPVPLLKRSEIQRQINDLALRANEKRYNAYLLEQQALQTIHDEVIYVK